MAAIIIDGKAEAQKVKGQIKDTVNKLKKQNKRPPGLGVILIGEDPASQVYVAAKNKIAQDLGFYSVSKQFDSDVPYETVKATIDELSEDKKIDGILLQLPLPEHLDTEDLLALIPADKDIDGLTSFSQGRLAKRLPALYPCTPIGILHLLGTVVPDLSGKVVGVIGRSILVGASITRLVERKGATTISLNSKTLEPKPLTKQCDILIVAAGVKHLVDSDWVKDGAVIIDVGIHRDSQNKLCGDVNFDNVKDKVSAITPVPGGVGPMTIAALMQNCLIAYELHEKF